MASEVDELEAWLLEYAAVKSPADEFPFDLPASAVTVNPFDEAYFMDWQREMDEQQEINVLSRNNNVTRAPELTPLPHQREGYGTYAGNNFFLVQ